MTWRYTYDTNRIGNDYHQVASQSHLSSDDIPDLDLYIDQIITLFDQKLENNKRYEDDKLLTKTMVNNYSKAKVITPIKGKKYSKEQIISMLMIYQLKNSLTIQEIKQLLTPYYQENISLENIYNQFYQIQDKQQDELPQFIHQYLKRLSTTFKQSRRFINFSIITCFIK